MSQLSSYDISSDSVDLLKVNVVRSLNIISLRPVLYLNVSADNTEVVKSRKGKISLKYLDFPSAGR